MITSIHSYFYKYFSSYAFSVMARVLGFNFFMEIDCDHSHSIFEQSSFATTAYENGTKKVCFLKIQNSLSIINICIAFHLAFLYCFIVSLVKLFWICLFLFFLCSSYCFLVFQIERFRICLFLLLLFLCSASWFLWLKDSGSASLFFFCVLCTASLFPSLKDSLSADFNLFGYLLTASLFLIFFTFFF